MGPNGSKRKTRPGGGQLQVLSQFYTERRGLLYHTADGGKRRDEEKFLHKHNLIILLQLYQTEVLFRSYDQLGHQGIDKSQKKYCTEIIGQV